MLEPPHPRHPSLAAAAATTPASTRSPSAVGGGLARASDRGLTVGATPTSTALSGGTVFAVAATCAGESAHGEDARRRPAGTWASVRPVRAAGAIEAGG